MIYYKSIPVETSNGNYENLGYDTGYKYYIPLTYNGSLINEKYCPHFAEERDAYEFINKQTDGHIFTSSLDITSTGTINNIATYKAIEYTKTQNSTYEHLGYKSGYKYYIALYFNGTVLDEMYCPHFRTKHDMVEYLNKETDAKTFDKNMELASQINWGELNICFADWDTPWGQQ
jgi:replication-associated recombination protein RarA